MYSSTRKTGDAQTKFIDMIFYRQSEIERAVRQTRDEMRDRKGKSGGSGHSVISDPTATQGIQLATPLKKVILYDGTIINKPEAWLALVKRVYKKLDPMLWQIAQRKYMLQQNWRQITTDMSISKDTYYDAIADVRITAKMAACQLGLIKVV